MKNKVRKLTTQSCFILFYFVAVVLVNMMHDIYQEYLIDRYCSYITVNHCYVFIFFTCVKIIEIFIINNSTIV